MGHSVHPTAIVEAGSEIGDGTRVWHFCHIRPGVRIGKNCIIGKGVYLDSDVVIGDNVKIQNNVSVFKGVEIGSGVFVGPHVCFTNDLNPRAVDPEGKLLSAAEWNLARTVVEPGASIGANSTVVAGTVLGKWCLVGAGSVVTKSVPPYALVLGNPARVRGLVDPEGNVISKEYKPGSYVSKRSKIPFKVEAREN
jgi:UDP-2-acetamido-3-amino-2,3-dideoxy-glucuronate N-acetyltransferase